MAQEVSKIKKIRRSVRYTIVYAAISVMITISGIFPRVGWIKFFGWLGGLSFWLAPQSRRLVRKHLRMVYGGELSEHELEKLVRKVFVMMGKNASDVIRAFSISTMEQMNRIRETYGVEHLERAYAEGKGVIFLVAHIGAFELMATEMSLRGCKPFIIGTPLKDARLNDLLWRQRGKLGATAIERGKDTIKLIRNLKSGGTVAILIDQDTKVKSRFVNFFGVPCATPIGATILAMKTGAAVVPSFIHMREEDHKHEIHFYPPIEIEVSGDEEVDLIVNTQRMNDVIEAEIRKYPSQWVWLHERWKTKPGEEIV